MYSCGYFESAADSLEQAQVREGRSHLPGAEALAHRSRARDWQRVGRLRRLGGDPLWLPRDDHDDQRRAVSPRLRMAVADRRGRGAHRGVARGLPRTDRAVRQGCQHRDVRGGRSQALRRLLLGRRPPARAGWRDVPADDHRRRSVVPASTTARRTGSRSTSFRAANSRRSARCCKSLARTTSLSLYHAENCGTHYAHTLRAWRARFHHNLARVRALGFDDRFIRMWDLYLGSCEATFLERHTGLFQLMLLKNGAQRVLFNEPWSEPATQPHAAGASESAA